MLIVVFGAGNPAGRLVLIEALNRGHHVRAFTSELQDAPSDSNLTVVQGSPHNVGDIWRIVQGSDAIINTLNSRDAHKEKGDEASFFDIRPVLLAMQQAGIERIVSLVSAHAQDTTDGFQLSRHVARRLAKLTRRKSPAEGEEHIRLLRHSTADWTVLRSPGFGKSARIFYKLSLRPPSPLQVISRRAVAKALLDQVDGPAYSKAAPYIHAL